MRCTASQTKNTRSISLLAHIGPVSVKAVSALCSEIGEHGFRTAARAFLQHDVELVAAGLARRHGLRDQRGAALGWHRIEQRILGMAGTIREINAGYQVLQQSAGKDSNRDMRCLHGVARTWHPARHDGGKTEVAGGVSRRAAEAAKARCRARQVDAGIVALGVGFFLLSG
jgi:limonene-1,2-epoxide hydrolase